MQEAWEACLAPDPDDTCNDTCDTNDTEPLTLDKMLSGCVADAKDLIPWSVLCRATTRQLRGDVWLPMIELICGHE